MRGTILSLGLLLWAPTLDAGAPDAIVMPHGLHHAEGLACADCHLDDAAPARPDMDVCADCHDVEDETACADCHTNVDAAGDYLRRAYGAIGFAHGLHLSRGLDCAACHGPPEADRPGLPAMADCRGCHETSDAYAGCALCHAPGFALSPADHDADWRHRHGLCARLDEADCLLCHTRSSCQDCHAGDNVRPRSHGLNYAFDHALDARAGVTDCATCHADPNYCSDCHAAERILPRDHSRSDWLNLDDGGRHAVEGIFHLESCVACHDAGAAEPGCAECH